MPLLVNLRHLANDNLTLVGQLPLADLDIVIHDDLVRANRPLEYDFEVEKMDDALLLQGRLLLVLDCECARCLKKFEYPVEIPHWACHLPLNGDEKAPIVGDFVDLTPYIREDILLELPQHPLCDRNCGGLKKPGSRTKPSTTGDAVPSPWTELDKLKL